MQTVGNRESDCDGDVDQVRVLWICESFLRKRRNGKIGLVSVQYTIVPLPLVLRLRADAGNPLNEDSR